MQKPAVLSRRRIAVIMAAVFLTNMLATLDQTIVGTALPKLAADLHGYQLYAWVFAAYLLSATATVAVVGKFSDIFGRKRVVLVSIALFAAGSLLCGVAPSMAALVGFRALQGVGGGGIATSTLAIIGDLFAPRDRARWQTVLSLSYATSSAIGPVVGGLLTDNLSWRWIFFVNLPLVLVAGLSIALALPRSRAGARRAIDWAGAGLAVTGVLALMLALTWGGREYAWLSAPVLGLVALAAGCGVAFPWVERRAAEPMVTPGLLRGRVVPFCCGVTFTQGLVWYGAIVLAPLYLQQVLGLSATRAGGDLTPAVVFSGLAGISAGFTVARLAHCKPLLLLGSAATLVGALWLALPGLAAAEPRLVLAVLVMGLGIGWVITPSIVALQNAVSGAQQGVAMGVITLFRQMGATLGTTMMGVFVGSSSVQLAPATLSAAIHDGFVTLVGGALLMLAMSIALFDPPLRGREALGVQSASSLAS
ncbi:MAG TPA: MDR family MFS transporter [Chloroflexota bacterium]|nr:MDR family MFS transporter [Chloroflexota bacterium]